MLAALRMLKTKRTVVYKASLWVHAIESACLQLLFTTFWLCTFLDGTSVVYSDQEVFATLITTEDFLQGAVVISRILRTLDNISSKRPLVALVYDMLLRKEGGKKLRQILEDELIEVLPVPWIGEPAGDRANDYPQYHTTYMKFHLWNMTAYSKIVYIDSDTLPLSSLSSLFDRKIGIGLLAAAPDICLPDSFNAGVMLVRPDARTFKDLIRMSKTTHSYDGGDQGILNDHFSDWHSWNPDHRLPFAFNVPISLHKLHWASWRRVLPSLKVLHFSGGDERRPWRLHGTLDPFLAAATVVWEAIRDAPPHRQGADGTRRVAALLEGLAGAREGWLKGRLEPGALAHALAAGA